MTVFTDIDNLQDLKRAYRRLAARWHPDRGGDAATMQQINALYEEHRIHLEANISKPGYQAGPAIDAGTDFSSLEVGYTVWVNGTECEVTAVTTNTFRVVARGRNRQAVFDRSSGIGKFNTQLRASFDNRHAQVTH